MSIISTLNKGRDSFKTILAGPYNIDRENVSPEEKQEKEYNIRNAQSLFYKLLHDRTFLPSKDYSEIQTLRNYANGSQDPRQYISQLIESTTLGTDKNAQNTSTLVDMADALGHDKARDGYGHINTKIVSVANKLMNMYYGLFSAYEEDIFIDNIDEDSGAEKDDKKYKAYVRAEYGDWINQKKQNAGIPIDPSEMQLPKDTTSDELEMFYASGGFKLNYARIMEKLIRYAFKKSRWDTSLKRKLVHDVVSLGFVMAGPIWDEESQEEMIEYWDPEDSFIQYSKEDDFNDAEYGGKVKLWKVSELMQRGFTSDELKEAAQRYIGWFGNPDQDWWNNQSASSRTGDWYFDFNIPVMFCRWIDVEVYKEKVVTNRFGNTKVYDVDFYDDIKENKSTSKRDTHLRKTYQCHWIIGTDMAFDYGAVPFQERQTNKKPSLGIYAYNLNPISEGHKLNSIISRIIPFLDQLQISWLRYQDLHARMVRSGYMINLRLLQNLDVHGDGSQSSPMEAMGMLLKNGLLPYMDTMQGQTYKGGDVVPVHRIEGGMGTAAQEEIQNIKLNIDMISEMTGISPVDLGAMPGSDQPVTTTQMQQVGSNQINRPLIDAVFTLKGYLAGSLARRIQLRLMESEDYRDHLSMVVGRSDVETLANARIGLEYGVFMEPRPDEQEKQELIQAAQAALQRGRDGEAIIGIGQFTYIIEQIRGGGNLKELRMRLDFLERKAKEEQQAQKMQLEQQRAQNQAQIEQQKSQHEIQMKDMDVKGELAVEEMKQKGEQGRANMDYLKNLQELASEEAQQEAQVNEG